MMKKNVESDGVEGVESGKQPGNRIRRKYRKFGLRDMEKNMKEGKYTDKIENPIELGGENKNKEMKDKVEYDGDEDGVTRATKSKKCKNSTPDTNTINDSRYNSCTNASRNIDNETKVTHTETNTIITNDEENIGVTEAEAATNSAKSNSSNNGIGSSNSKSSYVETAIPSTSLRVEASVYMIMVIISIISSILLLH